MIDVIIPFSIAVAIIFLGFIGNMLFDRMGFPDVILLIFLGVLSGPVLNLFPRESLISVAPLFTALTLIMILFGGGMTIRLETVFKQSGRAVVLALIYLTICSTSIFLFGYYALKLDFLEALLLGFMATGTSSVVIIPMVNRLGLEPETSLTLTIESTLTDIVTIVLVVATLGIYMGKSIGLREAMISLSSSFSVGIVIGFVLGVLWLKILYMLREEKFTYMSTVSAVIATYVISEYLGGSGAMSVLIFGLVIGNDADIASFLRMNISAPALSSTKNVLVKFQDELSFLMRSFFFVFLGLIYDFSIFPLMIGLSYAAVITLINLATRYVAALASTFHSSMRRNVDAITFLCGKGLAPAILSLMPLQYGLANANLYIVVITAVIIFTNFITSIAALIIKRKKLKVEHPKKPSIIAEASKSL